MPSRSYQRVAEYEDRCETGPKIRKLGTKFGKAGTVGRISTGITYSSHSSGQLDAGKHIMATVYIAYPGDNNTRFDRAYYAEHHLPLVMDCWEEYGLRSLAPFYPEHDGKGTVALCICIFADEEAVDASFASPRTAEVMKDIPNFTDAKAMQFKAVKLK